MRAEKPTKSHHEQSSERIEESRFNREDPPPSRFRFRSGFNEYYKTHTPTYVSVLCCDVIVIAVGLTPLAWHPSPLQFREDLDRFHRKYNPLAENVSGCTLQDNQLHNHCYFPSPGCSAARIQGVGGGNWAFGPNPDGSLQPPRVSAQPACRCCLSFSKSFFTHAAIRRKPFHHVVRRRGASRSATASEWTRGRKRRRTTRIRAKRRSKMSVRKKSGPLKKSARKRKGPRRNAPKRSVPKRTERRMGRRGKGKMRSRKRQKLPELRTYQPLKLLQQNDQSLQSAVPWPLLLRPLRKKLPEGMVIKNKWGFGKGLAPCIFLNLHLLYFLFVSKPNIIGYKQHGAPGALMPQEAQVQLSSRHILSQTMDMDIREHSLQRHIEQSVV